MNNKSIAFIGGGNMASAILSGLIENGYNKELLTVSAPSCTTRIKLEQLFGIKVVSNNCEAIKQADLIILAVKPQIMKDVCLDIKRNVRNLEEKIFVTLAAGTPIKFYKQILGENIKIIRVMPNTPSLVREGVSGIFSEKTISTEDQDVIAKIMANVGKVIWLKKEEEINKIIALAGSSPGYFFNFLDALQEKAETLGFNKKDAREIIIQVLKGITLLAEREEEKSFLDLSLSVASKGGATAQALKVFEDNNFKQLVANAMQATINRSQEIENELGL